MATWHPTIVAYEIHGVKRYSVGPNGGIFTTTVWVPNSAEVDEFMSYLILNRSPVLYDGGDGQEFVMRASYTAARPIDGCYTTDDNQEVIASSSGWLVDITYTTSVQSAETIFCQDVLVTERITQQTEFLKLDYNQFCWDVPAGPGEGAGTGTCSGYKPLRSPDETPGIAFKSFKVDMTIERLNIEAFCPGTADLSISDMLENMSGTSNNASVQFFTWNEGWGAETVMGQVNSLERSVELYGNDPSIAGSASTYWWWWTISLTFNVRPRGWNTFLRIDETGVNGYEWKKLRCKGSTGCTIFNPYPPEPYVGYILPALTP